MPKKHSYVLGLNAYDHDVSACLLRDGEIAYAIEKERITRQKHASGFFQEAVAGVGSYSTDIKEPGQLTSGVNPLARESESYYKFKGGKLETLKKLWLKPCRGLLS